MYAFYEKYPEFKTVPFFITGESYAGKYIPIFAKTILDGNEERKADGLFTIPLEGSMIGDPFNSPPI
jgi:cathepsin A (carboxypeptidase C)